MKKIILILLVSISFSPIISENTVILKNGKNLKGKVTAQDDKNLTVKLTDGGVQSVPKSQILKVIYKDLSEQEAEKIRFAEEKKLKEKEDREKAKQERERLIAEEKEKKRAAEEAKKAEELAKKEAEKRKIEDQKNAQSEEEWLKTRKLEASPEAVSCGGKYSMVWRSALLPGWGQYCGGRQTSAFVYGGLFFGSLAYALGPLRTQDSQTRSNYENLTLFNQVAGPVTKFTPQNISLESEFYGVFFESLVFNDIVAKSKDDAKAANARYLGGLGVVTIVYLTNVLNAYLLGQDRYPERPTITMGGNVLREGFDWNAGIDRPDIFSGFRPNSNSVYGELRYTTLY